MSVLIKGVNLPELSDYSKRNNTPEVYNLHGAIVVYPDGKVELKSYVGTFEGTYDVISVTPHGRLIDADALLNKHFGKMYFEKIMTATKEEMDMALTNIPLVINNAPTIIEAEEE